MPGFDERLALLKQEIVAQGRRVLDLCTRAVDCFFDGDVDKAHAVVADDAPIDAADVAIERASVPLLAMGVLAGYLGAALWGFAAEMDFPPLSNNAFKPSTPFTSPGERAFLAAVGGNCHSPVAALARVEGTQIRLRAEIFTANGRELQSGECLYTIGSDGPAQLAQQLLGKASAELRGIFAS